MKPRKLISAITVGILLMAIPATAFATYTSGETEYTSQVSSITLTDDGGGDVSWSVDGYSSKGFKLVWSKTEGPTYPTRSTDKYAYYSSSSTTSGEISTFDGEGMYYVRVCEYLSGSCGTYSNELTIQMGEEEYDAPSEFSDVDESHENKDAVDYLKDEGVVKGYSDGSYKPEEAINRAEFLKIVMAVYGYETEDVNGGCFEDVDDEWFAPYICTAEDLGLVQGYDDGYFRPEQTINFAEASKIVVMALSLEVEETDDEAWYQKYVMSLELVAAIPVTIETFDHNVTRGEMAEMVWRVETDHDEKETKTYDDIKEETYDVDSIELWSAGSGTMKWSVEGYSESGFKLVWSKTSGATYPTRSTDKYAYYSDPSTAVGYITNFDGDGTYYVRVCEYLGGSCGTYSNEVTVTLETYVEPEEEETYESDDVDSIELWSAGDDIVSWSVDGYSSSGFKLVWGKTSGPTYPTRSSDEYNYYSNSGTTTGEIEAFDGDGTYYVRVCEYLGGSCGVYSNEITVDLSGSGSSDAVSSITLSDNNNGNISWTVDGYSSKGYKVVWSKTSGPTYPNRSSDRYQYISSPDTTATSISEFDGEGKYYVRVCEYLGGACGVYSNEVQVNL